MALAYKYVTLPKQWPGKQRPPGYVRKRSPFKIQWTKTEELLAKEIGHLGGRDVTLAVDVRNPGFFRQDGMLKADARPTTPAVIISFTNRTGVRLTFPCDTFGFWQDNVHAIALSLESLRRVDRYGVTQGDQQYVGFRALPAGAPESMTPEAAAEIIAKHSGMPAAAILEYPEVGAVAVRTAQSKTHPDRGGSSSDFNEVQKAADVIAKTAGDGP